MTDDSDPQERFKGTPEDAEFTLETINTANIEGYVPIEELEALIQRWGERHDDEITMMEKAAWGTASRELHEVIQEYRGASDE